MLGFLPTALHALLTTLLWKQEPTPLSPAPLRFQLRHEHATSASSRNIFSDLPASFISADPHLVSTRPIRSHRPNSFAQFTAARHRSFEQGQSAADLGWSDVDVHGPDVRRRETLLTLAKMTSNTYYQPGDKDWYDLSDEGWNGTYPHGWEPHADGLRGHVLVSDDNSTVIITIKGTSAGWLAGGGGPTVGKDKLNDNRLFSCCCAKVGPTWPGVCPCNTGGYHCDQSCVESSLQDEDGFYQVGTNLYNNVTYMYPNANIWIVGHSLGGSLSSLLGATFGAPVVAFEAPAERLAARRLHLPMPPSTHHITHVYNTADPIPMGACTGVTSICAIGGYAMETRCRLGNTILYDTVNTFNWSVSSQRHAIRVVIEEILNKDWDPDNGIEVPEPQISEGAMGDDCIDCFAWEFGDFKKASISGPSAGGCARGS